METDLNLTDAERKQILDQRRSKERSDFLVLGAFAAADRLHQMGCECAGGDGEAKNPATNLPWGEDWFVAERNIRLWAAKWKPNV